MGEELNEADMIEKAMDLALENATKAKTENENSYGHGYYRGEYNALQSRARPLAKSLVASKTELTQLKALNAELVEASRASLFELARQSGFSFEDASDLVEDLEYPSGAPRLINPAIEALREALSKAESEAQS